MEELCAEKNVVIFGVPGAFTPSCSTVQPTHQVFFQIYGGKKVVIFGAPGAFTPSFSTTHLPGIFRGAMARSLFLRSEHFLNVWRESRTSLLIRSCILQVDKINLAKKDLPRALKLHCDIL